MTESGPVFIGGMYKSGTSLLRAMLGRHSRLFAGLETQWLHETWSVGGDAQAAWLKRMALFFDASPDELSKACGSARDIETCLESVMSYLAHHAGKSRWVEKTPGNAGVIGRIFSHWPTAQVLHITRDPRDVYASMLEVGKWVEPEEFAARWCATVGAARHWLSKQGVTTRGTTNCDTKVLSRSRSRRWLGCLSFSASHGSRKLLSLVASRVTSTTCARRRARRAPRFGGSPNR